MSLSVQLACETLKYPFILFYFLSLFLPSFFYLFVCLISAVCFSGQCLFVVKWTRSTDQVDLELRDWPPEGWD